MCGILFFEEIQHVYTIKLSIHAKNLDFGNSALDKVDKMGEIFNLCFFLFYGKNR